MALDAIKNFIMGNPKEDDYDEDEYFENDEWEDEEERKEPQNFMSYFKKDRRENTRRSYARDARDARDEREDSYFNQGYEEERQSSAPARLILVKAKKFSEVKRIAENLKQNRSVIINFEDMEKAEAQRTIDFMSGTTFAEDGHIQKISHCTFIFAVGSVDLIGRIEEIKDTESYFAF